MKKSTLSLVERLHECLLEFPSLVDGLEKKRADVLSSLIDWIRKAEEVCATYNLSEVSELAGLRSRIIAPEFATERGRASRKRKLEVASEVMYDLQHTVLTVLKPSQVKVQECRMLVRQLLGIVYQTGLVTYAAGDDFQVFVQEMWETFRTHEQLRPGAVTLQTSLPPHDILRLIAEEYDALR